MWKVHWYWRIAFKAVGENCTNLHGRRFEFSCSFTITYFTIQLCCQKEANIWNWAPPPIFILIECLVSLSQHLRLWKQLKSFHLAQSLNEDINTKIKFNLINKNYKALNCIVFSDCFSNKKEEQNMKQGQFLRSKRTQIENIPLLTI